MATTIAAGNEVKCFGNDDDNDTRFKCLYVVSFKHFQFLSIDRGNDDDVAKTRDTSAEWLVQKSVAKAFSSLLSFEATTTKTLFSDYDDDDDATDGGNGNGKR